MFPLRWLHKQNSPKPKLWHALLQYFFSALSLRCKASDSPHLDLNASVELLPSHVPHPMAWGCHRSILRKQKQHIRVTGKEKACAVFSFSTTDWSLPFKLHPCIAQRKWTNYNSERVREITLQNRNKRKSKKSYPSSILQHGSWEHAPRHVGHLIPDFELELLNKWICIIICTSHLEEEFFCITEVSNYWLYNRQSRRNATEGFYDSSPWHWKRLRLNCSTLLTYPQWKQLIPWHILDEIFWFP